MTNDEIAAKVIEDLTEVVKDESGVSAETTAAVMGFFVGEQLQGEEQVAKTIGSFGQLLKAKGLPEDVDFAKPAPDENRPLGDVAAGSRALGARCAGYLPAAGEGRVKVLLIAAVQLCGMLSEMLPIEVVKRLVVEKLVAGAKSGKKG